MSEHTQSADYEWTDERWRDISKGACCLGELLIRARVKLTYSPYRGEIDYTAETRRETSTKCVAYTCGEVTTGELSDYGPFTYNACEAVANNDNENGGKKITIDPNQTTFDPMGIRRPFDPGPLDDTGSLRFTHTVSLGCCDYGCAARFWDGGSLTLFGSVPGSLIKIKRRIDIEGLRPPFKVPRFVIQEGMGFSKKTWNDVFDDILTKIGPGGQYPYKFKPCCKKGDSGGGNSGGSSGG